jgi:hypothetical protein
MQVEIEDHDLIGETPGAGRGSKLPTHRVNRRRGSPDYQLERGRAIWVR